MKLTLPSRKIKDNYLMLLGFVLLAQAAGGLGTIFTLSSIPTWYALLHKPFFSPPNWLFGPAWILLYILMGSAAYLIWRKHKFNRKSQAFWRAYGLQLLLNTLWTPLFFGLHWVGIAWLEILLMGYFIYRTILSARPLSRWSAYLLYPYLAWVTFASLLNLAILVLN